MKIQANIESSAIPIILGMSGSGKALVVLGLHEAYHQCALNWTSWLHQLTFRPSELQACWIVWSSAPTLSHGAAVAIGC